MKAWHFSENAYPYLPPADEYEFDPRQPAEPQLRSARRAPTLYDRYLDEWLIAEDEGMEIMLNEHHQTATCVDPAAPLVLAALARLTHKARLLILGNPIANRRQPVRVAEEMAMIDVLSRGRLEAGFVRGVPYEISPANSNPVRMNERAVGSARPHRQGLDQPRRAVQPRGPFLPLPRGQYLAAPVSTAASADLDQHDKPGRRGAGRRARLRAGHVPHRLRWHARDLRCLSTRLARGRPRYRRAGAPPGLRRARLHRAERG